MMSAWLLVFLFATSEHFGLAKASELVSESASELRPFVTDGCTAWVEGPWRNPNQWRHCCVLHDLAFWAGAFGRKPQADLDLRDCVAETGARAQAKLMYFGIRAGSRSPRKIPGMQWGNAWSATESRRTPLSSAEIDRLERELLDSRYDPVLDAEQRSAFIRELRDGRQE